LKKKEASQKWLSKIERIIQEKGKNIEFKSYILENPTMKISSLILDYTERENIDLIVAGNRARHGFKRLLLGNVASNIVPYSHCPILVVKRDIILLLGKNINLLLTN
jgi:nucleotide-binding universal stress UspA family protein